MALIRVDGIGAGEYNAKETIQAEDYFEAYGISKKEIASGGFAIGDIENNDYLVFPNIKGLSDKSRIEFKVARSKPATIEIHNDSPEGELLANCNLKAGKSGKGFTSYSCNVPKMADKQDLCLVFKGNGRQIIQIDSFSLK